MDNIKKDYYPFPTQVKFYQRLDEGEFSDEDWGIAFKDTIICLHCGQPIDLNDEDTFIVKEETEWVELDQSLDDAVKYAAEWE